MNWLFSFQASFKGHFCPHSTVWYSVGACHIQTSQCPVVRSASYYNTTYTGELNDVEAIRPSCGSIQLLHGSLGTSQFVVPRYRGDDLGNCCLRPSYCVITKPTISFFNSTITNNADNHYFILFNFVTIPTTFCILFMQW